MNKHNVFFVEQNNIHAVTRPILIVARCFGIFSVSGLTSKLPTNLRSTFKSPYTLFVLPGLIGQIMLSFLTVINLFQSGANLRSIQKFVQCVAGAVCTIIVQKLARSWPKVVSQCTTIEKSLPKYSQKKISTSCNLAAGLMFFLATVEFILSVRFYMRFVDACPLGNSLMESYYMYTMPAVSVHVPYALWILILFQAVTIQIIFIVHFADAFIIIISLYLTAYFEELNYLVNLYKNKSPCIWNVLRMHYTKLTKLVKVIDDSISSFILFSYGTNITMTCIQLFKIIRRDMAHAISNSCNEEKLQATLNSLDRSLFYNFSTIFLIARALMSAFYASRVHATAKQPLYALYEVPSNCYNAEARRFVEQIQSDTIALSGQNFFYITRGMILTMVATVLTYELVLLQFSG